MAEWLIFGPWIAFALALGGLFELAREISYRRNKED